MDTNPKHMKIWHRLQAWVLLRRARKQHIKLQRYINHTAHEICGWKQEIYFLESDAARHLALAGKHRIEPVEATDKVTPVDFAAIRESVA